MPVYWLIFWSITEVVIFVAAVWAWRSRTAMYVGRFAVATLFILGGALFNALTFATGGDYAGFADDSYLAFVTDSWRAVVAPHQGIFIRCWWCSSYWWAHSCWPASAGRSWPSSPRSAFTSG